MTAFYQAKFFEGRYALNRAWQDISPSFLIGLTDSMKTKVLSFALELQDELGEVSEDIQALPAGKVDQTFVTHIYGGTAIIGSKDFMQIGHIAIAQGDLTGLSEGLESHLGLQQSDVSELKDALAKDAEEAAKPSFGKKTATWLANLGKQSGQAALSVGVEVVKKEATKWIFQYLGLPQ